MSDDDHGSTAQVWALRLALAACTDSLDGIRATDDEIQEQRGCWCCIARELLAVLATVADEATVAYIEAELAERLDAARNT